MKISASNCSPVNPLYKISLPVLLYPTSVKSRPKTSSFGPRFKNAVQSPKAP